MLCGIREDEASATDVELLSKLWETTPPTSGSMFPTGVVGLARDGW
jgi:hypothetical protein